MAKVDVTPSPPDSRKRPLDTDSDESTLVNKKSHVQEGHGSGVFHLKILVPSIATGAIIGKGGETIAQLQKDTNAKVKMSKANDYYPGTTERVCLITGGVEAIMKVLMFIMEKIKEKPDPTAIFSLDFDNKESADRDKQTCQVKILIPNSTAGMIIGRGGAYIRQTMEESCAFVQISQKAKDQSLAERCITIMSSDVDHCKRACRMILAKIVDDPQSGMYLNVSYADVNGPVANTHPLGSPFAATSGHANTNTSFGATVPPPFSATGGTGLGNLISSGGNLSLNFGAAFPGGGVGNPLITGQLIGHVRDLLRSGGFAERSSNEVCHAVSTLMNYGIIRFGIGIFNSGCAGLLNSGGNNCGNFGGTGGGGGSAGNGGNNALLGNNPAAVAAAAAGGADGFYRGGAAGGGPGLMNGTAGPFGPIGTTTASGLNLNQLGGPNPAPRQAERFSAGGGGDATNAAVAATTPAGAAAGGFDPFRRQSAEAVSPLQAVNSNSFGLGTPLRKSPSPGDLPQGGAATTAAGSNAAGGSRTSSGGTSTAGANGSKSVEVEVGEHIVGAILGPGGKSLVEIQHLSSTSIQISKKGEYAPGTRNRVVTIAGLPSGISTAQYLIEQRINEEESKRARHNAFMSATTMP